MAFWDGLLGWPFGLSGENGGNQEREEKQMKTENWNGHEIRFVQKDGEWWAVLKDVCDVLDLTPKLVKQRLKDEVVSNYPLNDINGRRQEYLIVNEKGIYRTIFQSRKPQAEAFQDWVMDVLIELRKSTGLEGFEVFRMLDKEHQKEAMRKLRESVQPENSIPYMKVNTIANKAISNRYGHQKMIKKRCHESRNACRKRSHFGRHS